LGRNRFAVFDRDQQQIVSKDKFYQ